MIAVIIAGGSGTRLWPLSTHAYPKQLLRIGGDSRSLLQNTYNRTKRFADEVYVLPEARLTQYMAEQLPEVDEEHLIIEPALRGTSSCVVAALAHVARRHDHDEPIAFMWADHHVRDLAGYAHSFDAAAKAAQARGRLVMVGVEPEYPTTGLGYIEKGDMLPDQALIYEIKSFREKPPYDVAQEYFRSGNYLWNAGYFVGSVNAFIGLMQQYAPELYANYQTLLNADSPEAYREAYLGFENIALEYAFTEKVAGLLVVPANFDWVDIGSFGDLHKAVDSDEKGNHIDGWVEAEEVENSLIQNFEDKPVAVIGLDNVVVVNTPNGILVARKDQAQKVGALSKRFREAHDA